MFKHGDSVTCEIEGGYVDDARISTDDEGCPCVVQNVVKGYNGVDDKMGYRYSYSLNKDFTSFGVKDLKLKNRSMKDLKQGDIITDGRVEKRVLGACGKVFFVSQVDDFSTADYYYTIDELVKNSYTLKSEEEPEELTMAQVEGKLGHKVKIIK